MVKSTGYFALTELCGQLTTTCNSVSKGSDAFLLDPSGTVIHVVHTLICRQHIHMYK